MDDRVTAKHVDIRVDETGKLWVNVDGICAMRIGYVAELKIETLDRRGGRLNRQSGTLKYEPNEIARAAGLLSEHITDKINETADEQSEALRITRRMMSEIPPAPRYTPEQQRAMYAPPPPIVDGVPLPSGDRQIVENLRNQYGVVLETYSDHTLAKAYREFQSGAIEGEFVSFLVVSYERAK